MSGVDAQVTSPNYPFWPYYGWSDIGPVQIPPLPKFVGLTDKVTGVVMYPAVDPAVGNRLVLTTTPPFAGANFTIYLAGDGPFIGSEGYKLILDNGRLAFLDQQPGAGPGPFLPVLGTVQYVAVLRVIRVSVNQKVPHTGQPYMQPPTDFPSGVQNGLDHLDFYFAAARGPVYRCGTPFFNAGAKQPAS